MILAELEQWSPYLWLVIGAVVNFFTALVMYCVGFEEGVK